MLIYDAENYLTASSENQVDRRMWGNRILPFDEGKRTNRTVYRQQLAIMVKMNVCLLLLLPIFLGPCPSQSLSSVFPSASPLQGFLDGKRVPRSDESATQPDDYYDDTEDDFKRKRRAIRGRPPLKHKQTKPRADVPCVVGNNQPGTTPWSLDSGNVPENLQAGQGGNDGLHGIKPSADSPVTWSSWDDSATWGSTEQPPPPPEWGNTEQPTWAPEPSSNEPPIEVSSEGAEEDCTCVSILQCGGTFRSGDFGLDKCAEGEVCCPVEKTGLPVEPTPGGDVCGVGHPDPSVKTGFMTYETAEWGEYPWTAFLMTKQDDNDVMFCAGAIIDLQIVLTAAHCVNRFADKAQTVIVRGGEWDTASWAKGQSPQPTQDRAVQSITIHPGFRKGLAIFDIAIILLKDPFVYANNLNTICLPTGFEDIDKSNCVAAGWGQIPNPTVGQPKQPNTMKKIVMPIVPTDECEKALRTTRLGKYFRMHKSYLCAGGNGKDVCLGDGGGPLTCPVSNGQNHVLMGITSWGVECGKPGIPGVYADITSETTWIKEIIGGLLNP